MNTIKSIKELVDVLGNKYYKATFSVPDLNSNNTGVFDTRAEAEEYLEKFTQ